MIILTIINLLGLLFINITLSTLGVETNSWQKWAINLIYIFVLFGNVIMGFLLGEDEE